MPRSPLRDFCLGTRKQGCFIKMSPGLQAPGRFVRGGQDCSLPDLEYCKRCSFCNTVFLESFSTVPCRATYTAFEEAEAKTPRPFPLLQTRTSRPKEGKGTGPMTNGVTSRPGAPTALSHKPSTLVAFEDGKPTISASRVHHFLYFFY